MEKIKLDLNILLPDLPNEQDACVQRIINDLSKRRGVDEVHVVPADKSLKTQLCLHYNPHIISVEAVLRMAEQAGEQITYRYHHLVLELDGIRLQRQTKLIEAILNDAKGDISVATSAIGSVIVEYDSEFISERSIKYQLKKQGLKIIEEEGGIPMSKIRRIEEDINPDAHKIQQKRFRKSGIGHGFKNGDIREQGEEKAHTHGGIFGKNTELIFSLVCGGLVGLSFLVSMSEMPDIIALVLYISAYFFGGYFTGKAAVQTILKSGFSIYFFVLAVAVGAAILGLWMKGALLLFLFSLGHALKHFNMEKAHQ